jgi:hypothetical protein
MSDYIAYHSTAVMGYEYAQDGAFSHLSRKPRSFLATAVGGRVWVVTGQRVSGKSVYRLAATYVPSEISSDGDDDYVIRGKQGVYFVPAIELSDREWFPRLFQEQNRFSYGFSRIRDASIIEELEKLRREYESAQKA